MKPFNLDQSIEYKNSKKQKKNTQKSQTNSKLNILWTAQHALIKNIYIFFLSPLILSFSVLHSNTKSCGLCLIMTVMMKYWGPVVSRVLSGSHPLPSLSDMIGRWVNCGGHGWMGNWTSSLETTKTRSLRRRRYH